MSLLWFWWHYLGHLFSLMLMVNVKRLWGGIWALFVCCFIQFCWRWCSFFSCLLSCVCLIFFCHHFVLFYFTFAFCSPFPFLSLFRFLFSFMCMLVDWRVFPIIFFSVFIPLSLFPCLICLKPKVRLEILGYTISTFSLALVFDSV